MFDYVCSTFFVERIMSEVNKHFGQHFRNVEAFGRLFNIVDNCFDENTSRDQSLSQSDSENFLKH